MNTFVFVTGIAAVFWGLTMLAVIDILLKDFSSIKDKAIWGFVALIPVVGWLIYLIFGYKKGIRKKKPPLSDND